MMSNKKQRLHFMSVSEYHTTGKIKLLNISTIDQLLAAIEGELHKLMPIDVPRGVYMYLGEYALGDIGVSLDYVQNNDDYFFVTSSERKDEKGICAVISTFLDRSVVISYNRMKHYLEYGTTIEKFLVESTAKADTDIIFTSDHKICAALVQANYQKVVKLSDSRELTDQIDDSEIVFGDNDNILFIKHGYLDRSENLSQSDMEYVTEDTKFRIWFVRNNRELKNDGMYKLPVRSASELRELLVEAEEDDPRMPDEMYQVDPYVRMYLGDYAIGGIRYLESENVFYLDATGKWLDDGLANRLQYIFGSLTITMDEMDRIITTPLTISEFLYQIIDGEYTIELVKDKDTIWNCLSRDYMVLSTLNGILSYTVKTNPELLEKYSVDTRVIVVAQTLEQIFNVDGRK